MPGSQTGPPYHTLGLVKGREDLRENGKFSVEGLVESHIFLAPPQNRTDCDVEAAEGGGDASSG
jgi:hypothetical protein